LDRVLGLIVLVLYVIAIMGFAGLITWLVIRVFPTKDESKKPGPPSDDGTPMGKLFRRAKRGEAAS
jgi:hypothetical protein